VWVWQGQIKVFWGPTFPSKIADDGYLKFKQSCSQDQQCQYRDQLSRDQEDHYEPNRPWKFELF